MPGIVSSDFLVPFIRRDLSRAGHLRRIEARKNVHVCHHYAGLSVCFLPSKSSSLWLRFYAAVRELCARRIAALLRRSLCLIVFALVVGDGEKRGRLRVDSAVSRSPSSFHPRSVVEAYLSLTLARAHK